MPFKSQAQRRKFAELLVQGRISPDTFEEWNRETGGRELPERVATTSGARKTKKKTAARKTKNTARKTAGSKKKSAVRKKAAARKR